MNNNPLTREIANFKNCQTIYMEIVIMHIKDVLKKLYLHEIKSTCLYKTVIYMCGGKRNGNQLRHFVWVDMSSLKNERRFIQLINDRMRKRSVESFTEHVISHVQ